MFNTILKEARWIKAQFVKEKQDGNKSVKKKYPYEHLKQKIKEKQDDLDKPKMTPLENPIVDKPNVKPTVTVKGIYKDYKNKINDVKKFEKHLFQGKSPTAEQIERLKKENNEAYRIYHKAKREK